MQALNAVPDGSEVVIDATKSHYIHPDIIEIMHDFMDHSQNHDIKVTVEGDFDEVNFNHFNYFMKKVSKDGSKKTPYIKAVFRG